MKTSRIEQTLLFLKEHPLIGMLLFVLMFGVGLWLDIKDVEPIGSFLLIGAVIVFFLMGMTIILPLDNHTPSSNSKE